MTRRTLPAAVLLAALAGPAVAQPPPAPIAVPPQAPTLNPVAPFGVPRGAKTELTLTGTNLDGPVGVLAGFPVTATFPADANNGKEPGKLRVVLDVPANAPLGIFPFRVATRNGVSNLRALCVDDLPQATEVDTNRTKAGAQPLIVPSVVSGRADAETADFFKVAVKAGQRLTFEVIGRRLGSAFDPVLFLHDARTGRPVPGAHSDDAVGLQGDARLTHTFPADGEFLIEVRDSTWRGAADFHYRLRVSAGPAATATIPAAVKRGGKAAVTFVGAGLEGVPPVEVTAPADPCADSFLAAPAGGWPVSVLVSDHEEFAEQEPNDDPAKAQRLTVPGGVTGRFLSKGDVDHYAFTAKKGAGLVIEAQTAEVGSPADVFLVVKDAKGAEVARSAPAGPARIDFNPPADGDFVVAAEHLNFASGPLELYRLTVKPTAPSLSVSLGLDRCQAVPGGTGFLTVQAVQRRGFNAPVELTVTGPAGVAGTVTIPAPAAPPPPNAPLPPPGTVVAVLPVSVPASLAVGAYPLKVMAKAVVNGQPVTACADINPTAKAALANLPILSPGWENAIALAVTDPPPFTLTVAAEPAESFRSGGVTLKAKVTRGAGFAEDVALAVGGLPPGVPVPALPAVPKDKVESSVALPVPANIVPGVFSVIVTGRAKSAGKDVAVSVPVTLNVLAAPFEVAAPPAVTLAPGAKAKVTLTVTRKAGYAGPVELELRNLPAGVTAPKVTAAANAATAEVELTAAPTAALGPKADVNVLGTAAGLPGGQQAASPNFAVTVTK